MWHEYSAEATAEGKNFLPALQFLASVPAFPCEGGNAMKRFDRTNVALGLLMIGGLCGMTQKSAAQESRLIFTVHVSNFAAIDSKTFVDAEAFATAIFRKSGVEARCVTALGQSGEKLEETDAQKPFTLSHLRLSILPRVMADRFGMRDTVMGLAPGSGANRRQTYVFYAKVEALAQHPGSVDLAGPQYYNVTKALILGHLMAHEIGHILLNLEIHTATGIMRGDWNMKDLLDAASGRLVFSTQQAEVIRTDVARRMSQQENLQIAGVEIASAAR
jgi:hypothetical protein